MRFDWSSEQENLFERTLTFARSRLNSHLDERIHDRRFSRETWDLMGRFGILGMVTPRAFGGMDLDALTTARVVEALGQGCEDMGIIFAAAAHLFACVSPIVEFGDDELKRKMLPRLSSGEWVAGNAITEAEAGSDVSRLRTLAIRDGDQYILNGTKTYVTNGPVADLFLVYGTRNPAHGYLGISAFVVERDTPGLLVGQPMDTVGLETATIGPLYLEDCRIPASNRVGPEGRGSMVFASSMLTERSCLFAMYLGSMQRQLDNLVAHAAKQRHTGRTLQAGRHTLVDMKLRLESARLLLYRACWERTRGARATLDVALAKLAISEAAIQSSLDAFELMGAAACMRDGSHGRALRDSLPSTIFSGTSEIQRELVARELGL